MTTDIHSSGKTHVGQLEQDTLAFVEQYKAAFASMLPEAVAPLYEAPLLSIGDGKAIITASREALLANFRDVMGGFQRAGFVRFSSTSPRIRVLGLDLVEYKVIWTLSSDDGQRTKSMDTTYIARRSDGRFRIVTVLLNQGIWDHLAGAEFS
jgi:hypothetical protein